MATKRDERKAAPKVETRAEATPPIDDVRANLEAAAESAARAEKALRGSFWESSYRDLAANWALSAGDAARSAMQYAELAARVDVPPPAAPEPEAEEG